MHRFRISTTKLKMENQIEQDETSTNMKAFYASFDSSDTISPSHVVSFSPTEKTKKAIQLLQDFFSKDFSLLWHPGRCTVMKDILRYLLTLPQNEEFCMSTKSELQKMLRYFEQWSLEYYNASELSATAEKELSKANEMINYLDVNVKEFHEMEKKEMRLCDKLVSLEERKRKLEEEIEMVNVEIAKSRKRKDSVCKKKLELYKIGRELKGKRDDLMINVPKLKAEQEMGNKTRDYIEAEWIKVRQQFRLIVDRVATSFLLSSSPSSTTASQAWPCL